MAAVQTSVPINAALGVPGELYQSGIGGAPKDIVTRIATSVIPFGAYVVISGENVTVPALTTDVTVALGGIALWDENKASGGSLSAGVGYAIGDPVRVMRKGRCFVTPEEGTATAGAVTFARFTVNGGLAPGGIRSDTDTGKAVAIPFGHYVTGASTTNSLTVAVLEII